MRKSNTDNDRLFTADFLWASAANLLRFAAVYILFPVLPFAMAEQLGISLIQTSSLYLIFAAAMLLMGPFHAYLGDTCKRKNVLQLSTFGMLAALGYLYVQNFPQLLLLAGVQGACFSFATTAGITVAIDITTSPRRSTGNMFYAWAARLGMLIGIGISIWLYKMEGFRTLVYLSMICAIASMLFVANIYVTFRAPIGVAICNFDRFLLLRGWLPAINMLLIAFVPGLLVPLLFTGNYLSLPLFVILAFLTLPFTRIFVKLSQHCQRGTANSTCYLAMEIGILVGMTVACHKVANNSLDNIYQIAGLIALLSLLFARLLTYPYYKKKKVR